MILIATIGSLLCSIKREYNFNPEIDLDEENIKSLLDSTGFKELLLGEDPNSISDTSPREVIFQYCDEACIFPTVN